MRIGDIGDALRGIGGGACGIELGRGKHAVGMPCGEIVRIALIGQIGGHQWSEIHARGHRGKDPLAIGRSERGGGNRRRQIGHDNRAGELPRGLRDHGAHGVTIAEMQMPVVGAADCQRFDHVVAYDAGRPICHP